MAKTTGLGDNFYVGGYDLSGDVGAVDKISGGPHNPLDVTAINESAFERLGGVRDGELDFTTFMNSAGAHVPLSLLPTADTIGTYFRGTTLANPAACINAKQVGYDPNRDQAGNLTLKVALLGNKYGLEWGKMLTAGLRTDSAATTGTFYDDTAGTSFGGQAYFQLTAFSGTSVTIDIQSATTSGGSYSTTGLTTTAMTAIGAQRLATANTATINRYLKVVTTGTFSNAVFAVVFVRNATAGVVF